jgi:hypothetical protein
MNIDTYIYNKNFDTNIFKKHIKNNTPCLIKNFLVNNNYENSKCDKNEKSDVNINSKYSPCGINSFVKYIKNIDLKCTDYGCFNETQQKLCCSMPFLDNLIKDNKYFFQIKKDFGRIKKIILQEIIMMATGLRL